jgi:FtsP/CotA-like multicopper oxidase with cupredoxin domain
MEMDGVNGVTQCPIAPNDTFTYTFRAMQYGTSWYHSHYSLQYADGLLGPITIYGPSSSNYDEGRDPILITDWSHRSAFKDWQRELVPIPSFPTMNSVLINGVGKFLRYSTLRQHVTDRDRQFCRLISKGEV